MTDRYARAFKRLNHWGLLLTGRLAGTLRHEDPRAKGYRDLFQKLLTLRAEMNAITTLLVEKRLTTTADLMTRMAREAEALDEQYAQHFVGIRSADDGLDFYDPEKAREHMKGWPA